MLLSEQLAHAHSCQQRHSARHSLAATRWSRPGHRIDIDDI